MSHFAVTRQAGPGWTDGKGAFEQPNANDHAAFMNARAAEGLVLLAGPLAGSERGRIRALLILEARSEDDIHERLSDDPWSKSGLLIITSIEPWTILVGADRLPQIDPAHAAPGPS
jgi:uncharacterized protein YciI